MWQKTMARGGRLAVLGTGLWLVGLWGTTAAAAPALMADDFVHVVSAPAGAPASDQPVRLAPMLLRTALSTLEVQADGGSDRIRVFSDSALDKLTGPLLHALAKAGPGQDVTFAITDRGQPLHSRMFGISPSMVMVTTGRAFYDADGLEIIFGQMHDPYLGQALATGHRARFRPGERAGRVTTGWSIAEVVGVTRHAGRGDWVRIAMGGEAPARAAAPVEEAAPMPRSAGAMPATAPAPRAAPGDAAQVAAKLELRLKVLEKLHKDGMISDQEYRSRREKLLDGI